MGPLRSRELLHVIYYPPKNCTMDDLPVTTSELAAGPSSSESGVGEEKDLKEKGAEGGEEESFRKLCTHYSRGCSLVVSKFWI